MQPDADGPFVGIRVLDMTHVLAGPFAAYQLGLLGADVIRVEPIGDPEQTRISSANAALNDLGMALAYTAQASNKRSIAIDIRHPAGRDIVIDLARTADVLIENYRVGALAEHGLGYEALKAVNPSLIYCSMTGYGQRGPRSSEPAYDMQIQATSGLMAATGMPEGGPLKVGPPVVDYATGTSAAFAIAAALFKRQRDDRGQHIDVSMLDSAIMLMSPYVGAFFQSGAIPPRLGNDMPLAGGCCYETKDDLLVIGAMNLRQRRKLYRLIGLERFLDDDRAETWLENRPAEREAIADVVAERTADEWVGLLVANDIPAARVRSLAEALSDPQLNARGVLHQHARVDAIDAPLTVPVAPFLFENGGPAVERPPPALGEHTDELLRELGRSRELIAALHADGIVATRPSIRRSG